MPKTKIVNTQTSAKQLHVTLNCPEYYTLNNAADHFIKTRTAVVKEGIEYILKNPDKLENYVQSDRRKYLVSKDIMFRLSTEMYEQIKALAKQKNTRVSHVIRNGIFRYLADKHQITVTE